MADILDKTENTTPASGDKLYIVDDPAGTPADQHITAGNLITKGHGLSDGIIKVASGTMTPATEDTDYQGVPSEGAFADGDKTKLDAIEASADVTDATNVASAGAVMADGTGNDLTGDIVFTEKADHSSTPSAGKGYLWVKNTAPSTLIFTDDAGSDTTLGSGGGGGISNVVEDTTPQLGGDLDVNGNSIVSVANGDINIYPNGTGKTNFDGDISLDNFGAVNTTYVRNGPDNLGLQVEAGDSSAGTAGNLLLYSGDSTTGTGGNVILKAGTGSTATGDIRFLHTDGLKAVTHDISGISTDRTITYPDAAGTLQFQPSEGAFANGDKTKLDGIATGADVTGSNTSASTNALESATTTVNVSSATAPSSGQVLTATSSTAATWQTPAAGGGGGNPYGATYTIGSGGDYATLTAYNADTPANGDILFIDGAHSLTAATTISVRVHIFSSGAQDSSITLGANNLTLSGNGSTVTGVGFSHTGTGFLNLTGGDQTITNCYFQRTNTGNQYCIVTSNTTTVQNSRFESTVSGLRSCFYSSSSYSKVLNNWFEVGASEAFYGTIHVAGAYAIIEGNHLICSSVTTNARGIDTSDGTYSLVNGNYVNNFAYGIDVGGRGVVSGNQIFNTSTASVRGIYISSLATSVTGNHIYLGGTNTYGIETNNGRNVISSNVIYGAGTNGIYIGTADDKNVVSSNVVDGFTNGINVSASTNDRTTIIGNELSGNTTPISDSGTNTFDTTATDSDPLNQLTA